MINYALRNNLEKYFQGKIGVVRRIIIRNLNFNGLGSYVSLPCSHQLFQRIFKQFCSTVTQIPNSIASFTNLKKK